MTDQKKYKLLHTVSRWILAIVFIYAGVIKIIDPLSLADAVAGFQIVAEPLIHPLVLSLPVLELLLGAMLLFTNKAILRIGALGIFILNVLFIIVLLQAWARGLNVSCGCFGISFFPESPWTLPIAVARDTIFLGTAYWLYQRASRQH